MEHRDCDYFGIELKGKYKKQGKHNGTFRGVKFFTASKKGGLFCKRNKIIKVLKRSSLIHLESAITKLSRRERNKVYLLTQSVRRLTALFRINPLSEHISLELSNDSSDDQSYSECSPFLKLTTPHD